MVYKGPQERVKGCSLRTERRKTCRSFSSLIRFSHFCYNFLWLFLLFYSLILLLVLNLVDKSAHMGEKLNRELITSFNELLGVLGCSNARRSAG